MNFIQLLYARFTSAIPKFWWKVLALGVTIGAIGSAVAASPDNFWPWLVNIAPDMIKMGALAALLAAFTTKNKQLSEK